MVIVFARAPLPGRAKTRLAAHLGEAGAARLQARLTIAALRTALDARCGAVELHATPRRNHPFLVNLARRMDVALRAQRGRNLGERMYRAFQEGLRRHRNVLLIGSDCPELRPSDLRRAARWLKGGCDAVLAPAEDGGYALLAARRVSHHIFADIAWGGARVYADTIERLERCGYRWRSLRTVWDVDRPQDLARLRSLRFSSALRRSAPR